MLVFAVAILLLFFLVLGLSTAACTKDATKPSSAARIALLLKKIGAPNRAAGIEALKMFGR